MAKISTARETLARMNQRIASEPNPKYKKWMEVNRDHWWGEVIGDLDLTESMLSKGPIRYTYDGHPFMLPDGMAFRDSMPGVTTRAAARQMYESIQARGARAAGPFDDERFLIDEKGMLLYGILTTVFPGSFITRHSEPIDPKGLYLVRVANLTMVWFDEEDKMKGEEIINGAPFFIRRVDSSVIQSLIDGPITVD